MLDDTKSRLLEAAGAVFADRGFHDATVRDICHAADVNLASVNYYFGDKERLYIETVKQAARRREQQIPMPEWPAEMPAADRLRSFIGIMLERMLGADDAPWRVRLMLREILSPTAACRALVQEHFRPTFGMLMAILRELIPTAANDKLHKTAFSVIGQCLFYRVSGEVVTLMVGESEMAARYTPEMLAEHIAQFSLAAVAGLQCETTDQTTEAEGGSRSSTAPSDPSTASYSSSR